MNHTQREQNRKNWRALMEDVGMLENEMDERRDEEQLLRIELDDRPKWMDFESVPVRRHPQRKDFMSFTVAMLMLFSLIGLICVGVYAMTGIMEDTTRNSTEDSETVADDEEMR